MRSAIRLYLHYVSIHIRSAMQYKTSFFLTALGQFLVSFNVFLGIFFLFRRFHSIAGFSYSEVLLSFSLILIEFSLAESVARGFDQFSRIVRQGEFDRILVRPRGTVLQVLGSSFEMTRFGRLAGAVGIFVYALCRCHIAWSVGKALLLLFTVIGGIGVFSGLFMINAALCFFTLEGLEVMNIFTDGAKNFGRYPFGVYGNGILRFCTFVIPYALVQYYPLLYLLGRSDSALLIFVPLAALLFLLPSYALWRFGVYKYKSSGS